MANTATLLGAIPAGYTDVGDSAAVQVYNISIDTAASDLTIYTPDSDKRWACLGILYSESAAHNLTLKSGSTTLATLEFSSGGLSQGLGEGAFLMGVDEGDGFVIQSSAAISSMLIYVQQVNFLRFS